MRPHTVFPVIRTINDVLPAIDGDKNFIIADRGDYKVIDYVSITDANTFPEIRTIGLTNGDDFSDTMWLFEDRASLQAALRRECRGLIFDKDGKILSRRFHKFWNLNEREETRMENIDIDNLESILTKEDGSMISFIPINGEWKAATMMGCTDVAAQVDKFLDSDDKLKTNYLGLVSSLSDGWTCIFEWCSSQNRIVMEYPKDTLILTAIRNNVYGNYLPSNSVKKLANSFDIPTPNFHTFTTQFVNDVRIRNDIEGVVLIFTDGSRIKLKTDEYVLMHRAKSTLSSEKTIIQLCVEDKIDDVLPLLPETDRKELEQFNFAFQKNLQVEIMNLTYGLNHAKMIHPSKKEFGLRMDVMGYTPVMRQLFFKTFGRDCTHNEVDSYVREIIIKHCTSNSKVDEVRYLWGNINWTARKNEDGLQTV